jgi:hypothetical protein
MIGHRHGQCSGFLARTLERIEKAAAILISHDPRLAADFIRERKRSLSSLARSRKTRLEKPLAVQNASSNIVDLINCLRRINSQLTSIAYNIVRDSTQSGKTSIHIPLKNVAAAKGWVFIMFGPLRSRECDRNPQ